MSKDYYKILGVEKSASKAEIKKAYKKLAKKYHPDLNKGDKDSETKFKDVNEAASVLGDDGKRSQYDQFGSDGPGFQSGFNGFDFNDFGSSFDFGDIFDQFFGGGFGGRRSSVRRGSDLRFDMEITLEDAAFGTSQTILVPRNETCKSCEGTGAKDKDSIKTCDLCHGSGQIRKTQRTPFGLFQTQSTCDQCNGSGKIYKELCEYCDGNGVMPKKRKLKVTIPAGVDSGNRLRISGEGEAGLRGGPPGDLYVVVFVKRHRIFERDGHDIIVDVPISFTQAVFGDEIDVPTLKNKVKMKIPKGTQSHTVFNIRGKGIPVVNGYGKGDQKVKVIVQIPEKLTKKQREVLSEYGKEMGEQSKPQKGFFEKIKEVFE